MRTTINIKVKKFWSDYVNTLGQKDKKLVIHDGYTTWDFGEDKSLSDKLCRLVLAGKKKASADLYPKDKIIPRTEDKSIILNCQGEPFCVVEYINVDIKPINQVSSNFIEKEG